MNWLLTRRYKVWLVALAGFGVGFGLAYVTNSDAKDAGEATGYAFLPGVFAALVFAFLAFRQNRSLDRKEQKDADHA